MECQNGIGFDPEGVYRVYFNAPDDRGGYQFMVEGRIANFNSGDVVIEDSTTKTVTIVKYRDIVQLRRLRHLH